MKQRLIDLARRSGADLVGFAAGKRLADAPPSGDPAFLLPSARSVISFAVALDPEAARAFLSKTDWLSHCQDRKTAVRKLYTIGESLVQYLTGEGFEALNVEVNNTYRPEKGASDITEMTEFLPDFSHRYGAVAAGIGRLGWSGNLMTPRYGALVELGSVITSAELDEDPVMAENPCDGCLNCVLVCPVQMMSARDPEEVTVAGVREQISRKRPNTCCWIGCTGYEGLSKSGKWSNWSPYRLDAPLPEDKEELDSLCIRLQKADPQMQSHDNVFADYRGAVFDPQWSYYMVCGFCRSVCHPSREDRVASRKELHGSGVAVLRLDGMHVTARGPTEEIETPFGVKVVMPGEGSQGWADAANPPSPSMGMWPMDREVLAWLAKRK